MRLIYCIIIAIVTGHIIIAIAMVIAILLSGYCLQKTDRAHIQYSMYHSTECNTLHSNIYRTYSMWYITVHHSKIKSTYIARLRWRKGAVHIQSVTCHSGSCHSIKVPYSIASVPSI